MENEEKIGFFKRIGIAITNPKDYYKIAKQGIGKSIGTYFFVSIIYTIVIIFLLFFLYKTFSKMAKEYVSELPPFSISKNGFISQMEEPIEFYDDASGILAYIDSNLTLEEIKNINKDKIYISNTYLLLGKDAFSIKSTEDIISKTFQEFFETNQSNNNSNESLQEENVDSQEILGETTSIADISNNQTDNQDGEIYEINNQSVIDILNTIDNSNILINIYAITALISLVIIFISFIFMGLLYSILTFIVCILYKKKLSFREIYNISLYSNLTVSLLSLLLIYTNFSYWGIIRLVIVVFYMQIAIKNYCDTNQNIVKIENDDNENNNTNI